MCCLGNYRDLLLEHHLDSAFCGLAADVYSALAAVKCTNALNSRSSVFDTPLRHPSAIDCEPGSGKILADLRMPGALEVLDAISTASMAARSRRPRRSSSCSRRRFSCATTGVCRPRCAP